MQTRVFFRWTEAKSPETRVCTHLTLVPPSSPLVPLGAKYRLGSGRVPEFGLPAAFSTESPVIVSILASGFDRAILQPRLRTSAGKLEAGDAAYGIVILPNLTGIHLEILKKLAEFCRSGGTLIATSRLPERTYGLADRERRVRAAFRDGAGTPMLWDAMTGEVKPARGNGREVRLELEPHGSAIVVFDGKRRSSAAEREPTDGTPVVVGGPWKVIFRDPGKTEITMDCLRSWTEIPAWLFFRTRRLPVHGGCRRGRQTGVAGPGSRARDRRGAH